MEKSEIIYGICVGRFQVDHPHEGHIALLNEINTNHAEMIIFLGIAHIQNTEKDPLNFNIRKMMLQELYPEATILPIKDSNSDEKWSKELDDMIKTITNGAPALLYGSRDSFLSHYKGIHKSHEYPSPNAEISATEIRNQIAIEEVNSRDFRKGIIYAKINQFPVTYPTVDIACYNEKGQILLGKKPYEDKHRCVGGFVDRTDENWEHAGRREWFEETTGVEIGELKYVASMKINDPRYKGLKSGIMTTLLIGKYIYGVPKAADDIEALDWFDIDKIDIERDIMPVHHELIRILFKYIGTKFLIQ